MNDFIQLFLLNLTVTLVAVLLLWALSIRIRDASIIDLYYGIAMGVIAVVTFYYVNGNTTRHWLMLLLVLVWVLRFSLHIFSRNLGHGEDPRYTKLRSWVKDEREFKWLTLKKVYLHQGVLIWLITMPVQFAIGIPSQAPLGLLAWLGVGLFVIGFLFEAIGDWQLSVFKRTPVEGKILDTGLWRYTRHPNYFGHACLWWGLFLIACEVPYGFLSFVGPLAINYYLINVTGMRILEKKMLKEKPAYAHYVQRTSGFVPALPRQV